MTLRLSIPEFQRWLTTFDEGFKRAVVRGLRRSAKRLERYTVQEIGKAEPRPAVDTGSLRQSVDTTYVEDGAIVTVSAPHAAFMEYGTRPFRPPLNPLIEWAKRKGLASSDEEAKVIAFKIRASIEKRGIAPRGYFQKAWSRMLAELSSDMGLELAKWAKADLSKMPQQVYTGRKGGRYVITSSGRRRYLGRRGPPRLPRR